MHGLILSTLNFSFYYLSSPLFCFFYVYKNIMLWGLIASSKVQRFVCTFLHLKMMQVLYLLLHVLIIQRPENEIGKFSSTG